MIVAYLMTAVMTGGVAALAAFFTGGGLGQIAWNYMLFGHLGIAVLALAIGTASYYAGSDKS